MYGEVGVHVCAHTFSSSGGRYPCRAPLLMPAVRHDRVCCFAALHLLRCFFSWSLNKVLKTPGDDEKGVREERGERVQSNKSRARSQLNSLG